MIDSNKNKPRSKTALQYSVRAFFKAEFILKNFFYYKKNTLTKNNKTKFLIKKVLKNY